MLGVDIMVCISCACGIPSYSFTMVTLCFFGFLFLVEKYIPVITVPTYIISSLHICYLFAIAPIHFRGLG